MTKTEVFEEYYDEIKEQLISCSEEAMLSGGKVKFAIYAGQNYGVRVLEDVSGGTESMSSPGLYLITSIDYGAGFNPAEYLPYDTEVDESEYDEDIDYDGDDYGAPVDEDMIARVIAETNWDDKMAEIQDEMYYER